MPSARPKRQAMTARPSVGPALTFSDGRAEFTGARPKARAQDAVLLWFVRVRVKIRCTRVARWNEINGNAMNRFDFPGGGARD